MFRYLSNKKVCVGNECPACEKPTSYKGRVISTLSRTSRTQCTSRNVEAGERKIFIDFLSKKKMSRAKTNSNLTIFALAVIKLFRPLDGHDITI